MGAHALISDRALVGMYYNRLENGDLSWTNGLAMEVTSSQDSETHKWLGMPPGFEEWVGGRKSKGFLDFDYSIDNKDYESTIRYHERDLAEDKTGQLQIRINEHSDRAQSHDASLLSTLVLNGGTGVCYDGQYYFDTDHSEGSSGTQSNKIQVDISALPVTAHGSITDPSTAEMAKAILKSIETILGFKDDRGEPLNERATNFTVMVPISLFIPALEAVGNMTLSQGETNTLASNGKFNVEVIPNTRLSWTTKFTTFRTDGAVKPFINQVRERLSVDVLGQNSEHFFETREIKAGLKKAGAYGYGLWQGSVQTELI